MNINQVESRIRSLEQALEFLRSPLARVIRRHHLDVSQSVIRRCQQQSTFRGASWQRVEDTTYFPNLSIIWFTVPIGGTTLSLTSTIPPSFNAGTRFLRILMQYLSGQSCSIIRRKKTGVLFPREEERSDGFGVEEVVRHEFEAEF